MGESRAGVVLFALDPTHDALHAWRPDEVRCPLAASVAAYVGAALARDGRSTSHPDAEWSSRLVDGVRSGEVSLAHWAPLLRDRKRQVALLPLVHLQARHGSLDERAALIGHLQQLVELRGPGVARHVELVERG